MNPAPRQLLQTHAALPHSGRSRFRKHAEIAIVNIAVFTRPTENHFQLIPALGVRLSRRRRGGCPDVLLAEWMNRNQRNVMEYLQEEVRVLTEQLGKGPSLDRIERSAKENSSRKLK